MFSVILVSPSSLFLLEIVVAVITVHQARIKHSNKIVNVLDKEQLALIDINRKKRKTMEALIALLPT